MFWHFYKEGKKQGYWQKNQKILLAISGGVDSMVLLRLMELVAEKDALTLAVAHVNHQLRAESEQEAAYLQTYCQEKGLPYFEAVWQTEDKQRNVEARGRQFRYAFFEKIMRQESFQSLMTGHHLDDQAETILMKLTRGTAFANTVGIRQIQKFGEGTLIRPLLTFSKEELSEFAATEELVYFEDHTNQSTDYTRNRLRNQVIPLLKVENPGFLQHMEAFSQQQALANQLIQEQMEPKVATWVKKTRDGWQFPLQVIQEESDAFQQFFLMAFFQATLVKENIQINQRQLTQILSVLNNPEPQSIVSLEKGWQFIKSYEIVRLEKKKKTPTKVTEHALALESGLFLSETEWIGLTGDNSLKIPKELDNWREEVLLVPATVAVPFTVRHRKEGDKIKLHQGLTKKLRRIFIDQKVPNNLREQAWVVVTKYEEIIWVPGFANSYLSIPQETDKIHYRLLFKTKE